MSLQMPLPPPARFVCLVAGGQKEQRFVGGGGGGGVCRAVSDCKIYFSRNRLPCS